MAQIETPLRPTPPSSLNPPASPATESSQAITTQDASKDIEPPQKKTKLIRRKRRPARPQVDPSTITSEPPPQTGTIFNIWYNKWSGGDREDAYLSKTAAKSRCNISRDSGYTRADKTPGSFFCLFFARGTCPKGHECQYLHRLPTIFDVYNPNVDCFGRDKFSDYRDDMGGVGSFMRQNRTLYCGRIHVTDDIEEIVARHFAEWGQVDRTRVLTSRGVAFITYTNEANSQFAKEAMANQALDHDEILNVRWATVDPNPLAQKREAARIEEQAAEAVRRALPADFVAELEGRETPEMKRRRLVESGFGLEGYEAPDEVWHARSKELEEAKKQGQIEGAGEGQMIENAPVREVFHQDSEADAESTGIFSSSTLAKLEGYTTMGKSAPAASEEPSGPLVGYTSDGDSD